MRARSPCQYLTGRVIDQVLGDGDRAALAPLVRAVVGIAVVRMALGVAAALDVGQVSLAVEYDLRARCSPTCSGCPSPTSTACRWAS